MKNTTINSRKHSEVYYYRKAKRELLKIFALFLVCIFGYITILAAFTYFGVL